jgi:uncharacterized protein YbjT (DUF2867 family)
MIDILKETTSAQKLAQVACYLEALAGADQRPGHVAYLTKPEMAAMADKALAILEVAISQVEAA